MRGSKGRGPHIPRASAALASYHDNPARFPSNPDPEVTSMLVRRALLVLALVAVVPAGRAVEVSFLKGTPIKGELVSINDKEIVIDEGGKKVTRSVEEILKIELKEIGKPAAGTSFADVELVDGTILHCSKWLIKKREVELTLVAGPTVKVPLNIVANVLNKADKEAIRKEWTGRAAAKRGKDILVIELKGEPGNIDCVFGEGNAEGTQIELSAIIDGEVRPPIQRELSTVYGLIFKNTLDAKAPTAVCKLFDTVQDVVMVSSVTSTEKGLSITTPAGAKIDFVTEQVAVLDYSKGRRDYLSDVDPLTVVTRSNVEDNDDAVQQHIYKDVSMKGDKALITLGGVTYRKGLVLRPHTELTYNLKGEYGEFSAVVGLDDNVGADGPTTLIIEKDGAALSTITIAPTDKKKFQTVKLNIKDAQRLRIIVKSGDLFDLGKHMDLADVMVSK